MLYLLIQFKRDQTSIFPRGKKNVVFSSVTENRKLRCQQLLGLTSDINAAMGICEHI